jgi:hypothetical protein
METLLRRILRLFALSPILGLAAMLAFGIATAHADTLLVTNSNNTVTMYDQTGAFLGNFTATGPSPKGIVLADSGNILVANSGSNTVFQYSQDGTNQGAFISSNLNIPYGLAITASGNLFVGNVGSGTVAEFDPTGAFVGNFISGLLGPTTVAFASSGNLFVCEAGNLSLSEYDASGVYVRTYSSTFFVYGVAFTTSGNILSTDFNHDKIEQYTPDGTFVNDLVTTNLSGPYGIAFGSSGNFYVANTNSATITQFLPDGTYVSTFDTTGLNAPLAILIIVAPNVTSSPGNQTVDPGTPAVFTASAGNHPVIQWQRQVHGTGAFGNLTNNANFSGVNTTTLTVLNPQASMSGDVFRCVFWNLDGTALSAEAALVVNGLPGGPPLIIKQPKNTTAQTTQTVSFTVAATGSPPLKYDWKRNGVALKNGGRIYAAKTSALTLKRVIFQDAGSYSVTVSNAFGAVTSAKVRLTVVPNRVITKPAGGIGGRIIP